MPSADRRVMRIVLPVGLVRDMDSIILDGLGGYATRAEFIIDAIQERLSELTGGVEIDSGAPPARSPNIDTDLQMVKRSARTADVVTVTSDDSLPGGLARVVRGAVVAAPIDEAEQVALFGMHNRDFPTLWTLARLASLTERRTVPVEDFYADVLKHAWEFGSVLAAYEERTGIKSTALFPTNLDKRKSAEAAFRSFAIGDYRVGEQGGAVRTFGPIFEWRAAAIERRPDGLAVGMTSAGWELLDGMVGVSALEPHGRDSAIHFLSHLASNAPADRAGFAAVLRAVGDHGATRTEVLSRISETWPTWSDSEVSTNAAGYIARSREWGLLQPKQTTGRYYLTDFGTALSNESISGGIR